MGSLMFADTKETIINLGHEVDAIYYHFKDRFKDSFFEERIDLILNRKDYDLIFSINFFPLLAQAAHTHSIPYVSWSHDSPLAARLSDYFHYNTNYIYLFDREEVTTYNSKGYSNVYHMPLAVNPNRISNLHFPTETNRKYSCDISFVGTIYNSPLDDLLFCATDYVKGFVEGLFQSQFRVYGCNYIEKSIPDSIIDSLNTSYAQYGTSNISLNKLGLAYAINAQITHVERILLLESLAETHEVHFYTKEIQDLSDNVIQHGPVRYLTDMNAVFKNSALNLCPTLRSIISGIPLRSLDILVNKAVLFSNYQPELAEYFSDGEDLIMYESIEDAIAKADYYLAHKEVLEEMKIKGYEKVIKYFSYEDKIKKILDNIN